MNLKVTVSADMQTVVISAVPGSLADRLYNKWYKSQKDEDWQELLDWITPYVADNMEIEIEEVDKL